MAKNLRTEVAAPTHVLTSDGTGAGATLGYTAIATIRPVTSVAGDTGDVILVKADVGLGNVDNTSDANKPISSSTQTALDLKADTSSLATVATSGQYSALIGIPTTFTPTTHNQAWSTIIATPTTLGGYGITDAETTTQLNTRDTNNRSRANHTGTQAASTITGLAAVATSGSYNDLSGTPSIPSIANLVSSTDVVSIVKITQADYDTLTPKVATTFYIIEEV